MIKYLEMSFYAYYTCIKVNDVILHHSSPRFLTSAVLRFNGHMDMILLNFLKLFPYIPLIIIKKHIYLRTLL